MARYFGSALLGLGVIYSVGRGAKTAKEFLKAGLLGEVGLNVLLYGFITVGFGYFYFKKQPRVQGIMRSPFSFL